MTTYKMAALGILRNETN